MRAPGALDCPVKPDNDDCQERDMPASALMNVMIGSARKAGRSLARDFGEVEQLQVSLKGPANFVTAADTRAEEILHKELTHARPGYGLLMEERGEVEGADRTHRFIVDPLDGTTNFLHGIPLFAISIALERDGDLVAGLIYNPASNEMFTAERGKGAFLNDRRLRVSARTELADCVIVTGVPHRGKQGHDLFLREMQAVMAMTSGIRRTGAATLRRLLGAQFAGLGPCGGDRGAARGRRLRQRRRRQGSHAGDGKRRRRQRGHSAQAAEAIEDRFANTHACRCRRSVILIGRIARSSA
jgi:myo-inositol-1(or 4)-monophosphatase